MSCWRCCARWGWASAPSRPTATASTAPWVSRGGGERWGGWSNVLGLACSCSWVFGSAVCNVCLKQASPLHVVHTASAEDQLQRLPEDVPPPPAAGEDAGELLWRWAGGVAAGRAQACVRSSVACRLAAAALPWRSVVPPGHSSGRIFATPPAQQMTRSSACSCASGRALAR